MKKKPNKGVTYREDSHKSLNDLYRRFRKAFDVLLSSDDQTEFDALETAAYVRDPDIAERLAGIASSLADEIHFLIGRTGIGKTTVLKNSFSYNRNACIRDKTTLLVPFSFDNHDIDIATLRYKLAATFASVAHLLKEEFQLGYSERELIDFIKAHSRDVLFRGEIRVSATDEERLESLIDTDPYAFSLEQFKYYLERSDIENVIILVDDIESERHHIQSELIESFARAYKCICNFDKGSTAIKLIISCRPVTEQMMRANKVWNAFGVALPIVIRRPASLTEIFKARFEYAVSSSDYSSIRNREEWERSLSVLTSICEAVSDKYGFRMLALFNNNVRRTLYEFSLLVINRRWFQRNDPHMPEFRVEEGQFMVSEAAVYKALGMRNGDIYPTEGTCLKNILVNDRGADSNLIVIYIIKYLLSANDSTFDLDVGIRLDDLKSDFEELFNSRRIATIVEECLEYMKKQRLLEAETNEDNDYLYLMPRAKSLYDMLGERSLLLEMLRDDIYQDYSEPGRQSLPSSHLSGEGLFSEVLDTIRFVFSCELSYIEFFKNNDRDLSIRKFGERTITEHLTGGLKHSIHAYYHDRDIPASLSEKVVTLEEEIASIFA